MKHAKLSPSSAERWLHCPVTVKLSEYFKSEKKSDYLSEGQRAHLLAEREIKKLMHQDSRELDFEIEPDMHETINSYVNYITREVDINFTDIKVEEEVSLNWLSKDVEIFGTADCIAIDEDEIQVFDLKYGVGKLVEDDSQLKLYALGILGEHDAKRIVTHIYQPRRGHIARGEYSKEELIEWFWEEVYPSAVRALYKPFIAVSGEWCQFCAGRGYCREHQLVTESFSLDTESFSVDKPISELTIEEVVKEYKALEKLESRKKELKAVIENELKSGRSVKGYILKPGRKRREWKDSEKVREISKTIGIESKPLSPAKLEKKVGKAKFNELFSELVEVKEGKETVQIDHN